MPKKEKKNRGMSELRIGIEFARYGVGIYSYSRLPRKVQLRLLRRVFVQISSIQFFLHKHYIRRAKTSAEAQ